MPNYNFDEDLPIAKVTEREVANILETTFNATILGYGNTNTWDIHARMSNGGERFFEVKEDFSCEKTGNVGLEFECRGKPSGIAVSKADYYIYKIHTKYWGIRYLLHSTQALKNMIEHRLYFRIVNGGDKGSNTMNYLFKYEIFVQHGFYLIP